MQIAVQNLIVLAVLLAAVGYVLRQGWLVIAKKRSGCGSGCRSCAVNDDRDGETPKPFVSVDDMTKSFRQ